MNLPTLALASVGSLLVAALPASAQLVVDFDNLGSGTSLQEVTPLTATAFADLDDDDAVVYYLNEGAHSIYSGAPNYDRPTGVTPADVGDPILSVLLHYTPQTGGNFAGGTITFDREILGVYTTTANLNATDANYGASIVNYSGVAGDSARGLEAFPETAIIDSNKLDLSVIFANTGASQIDQIRVILVPEPSTYALALGVIVLGIVGVRRWREKRDVAV